MKLKTIREEKQPTPYVRLTISTDFNDGDYQTEITEMSVEDFDFVSDLILDMLVYLEEHKDDEYPFVTWINEQQKIWNDWTETKEAEKVDYQHPYDSLISYFPDDNDYDEFNHGHSLEEINAFYYDENGIKHTVIFETECL
jgi:hypothetical protein